jgi:hypothetical protein
MLHQSHFEPEAANNKQASFESMVTKEILAQEILEKIQFESMTNNQFDA